MLLSKIHFWGWQLIIVAAVITLPLGMTTGKEYAELEWPIDIAITLIWVVFGINMMGTIIKRRERHLYVAIWFYIATWVTVAMLHIVNSIELPISFTKSYSWYAGVQDALGAVVVRAQRGRLLPHHTLLGAHVLLPAQGREPSGVQLQALDHPLLVLDLPLHLGRPAPFAVQCIAGVGTIPRHRLQYHAHRTELGRYAERSAHPTRCMGPCT
jgi:hypothetical protein